MTNNPFPVGLGVIGCGSVFGAYMTPAEELARRGLASIVAACGRPHQRDEAVGKWKVPKFVSDERELLRMPEIDLVVILTSMESHGRLVRAALDAGKHVLVEKPLATTLEEARELAALARSSRGKLFCAPFTTLSPTYREIGRRLRRGEIGRVVSARGRYGWAGPWWNRWFYRKGGGVLFDLAVYNVTSLTGWLGPVRRVQAMAGVAIPEREVNGERIRVEAEDNAHIVLDFGGSSFALVTAGFTIQQYRGPAIELYGTEGALQMLGDDWDPDGFELWREDAGAWEIFKETTPDWPWTDGLRHAVECIRNGARPLVRPEHALHVLEVLIEAKEAARDGRARPIESSFEPLEFAEVGPSGPAHLIHDRTRKEE